MTCWLPTNEKVLYYLSLPPAFQNFQSAKADLFSHFFSLAEASLALTFAPLLCSLMIVNYVPVPTKELSHMTAKSWRARLCSQMHAYYENVYCIVRQWSDQRKARFIALPCMQWTTTIGWCGRRDKPSWKKAGLQDCNSSVEDKKAGPRTKGRERVTGRMMLSTRLLSYSTTLKNCFQKFPSREFSS